MNTIWTFVLLWGVWLITPVVFDGLEALFRLVVVALTRRSEEPPREPEEWELPTVTVVVPAHNEEAVIDRCLNSIRAQDYPHHKLEVIIVDDGSTDETARRVEEHINGNGNGGYHKTEYTNGTFILGGRAIKVGPFKGQMTLIKNGHQGKAHALNAGIKASTGEIVVNVDSDVVLAPDTVRNIAVAFMRDPDLGAATGNIEVDWEIVEERDRDGRLVLDENGGVQSRTLSWSERLLAKWQFLEYVASFRLGRESQARLGAIYTLAGACSAFRRSVLEAGTLYSNRTVSEDTHLTIDLHRQDVKIGFIPGARVYLEPVVDWDGLYAQRVRWTRGQLEVCGLNRDLIAKRGTGALGRFTLPQMLLFDHTVAFPRLVWMPLLLVFPLLGYSWGTILQALVAMYILYVVIETVNTLWCYKVAEPDTRRRIEQSGWALLGMPLYRFIVFHFRFSGFLVTLREEQQWTTTGPVSQTRDDLRLLRLRSIEFAAGFITVAGVAFLRVIRYAQAVIVPAVVGLALTVGNLFTTSRKGG
ncbi:MAG: putative glycosyltransferase, exosortase G system-associated [Coriobacteriia bacterium]